MKFNLHLFKKSLNLLPKPVRKHDRTLFIEGLATELLETYKHLAGISEEKEKQCLQNGDKTAIFNIFQ